MPAPLVWFAAYLAFSMFQMIWAPGSVGTLLLLVEILVVALVVANHDAYGGNGRVVEYSFYFAVLCTFVYNLFSHEVPLDGRIGSTLVNANGYAQVLMFGVLFALRQWLVDSAKRRVELEDGAASARLRRSEPIRHRRPHRLPQGHHHDTGRRSLGRGLLGLAPADPPPAAGYRCCCWSLLAGVGYGLYQSPQTERITEVSAF